MINLTENLLVNKYKIKHNVFELYKQALNDIEDQLKVYDEIREYNQLKVLHAFQEERISDSHFTNSSGYGYDDIGREALDKVYARVFNAESALVRPHFVNGTHAIGCALMGNLKTGDTMVCISGTPYDTLHNIIGINDKENIGSLREYGVKYKQVDLLNGKFDVEKITEVYFEYNGEQILSEELVGRIQEAYKNEGHRISSIKTLRVYINPDERKAYYVINDKAEGKFVEF